MTGPYHLLDEHAAPPLRQRLGGLLAGADSACFALARVRLGVLDFDGAELATMTLCRVLLGHLDATTLLEAAEGGGTGPVPRLGPLIRFIADGRLQVRSAGRTTWSPDFGVVRRPDRSVGLMGTIRFDDPRLMAGPSFTMVTTDPAATDALHRRFDQSWEQAHDVLPAIRNVLEAAHDMEGPAAAHARASGPRQALR